MRTITTVHQRHWSPSAHWRFINQIIIIIIVNSACILSAGLGGVHLELTYNMIYFSLSRSLKVIAGVWMYQERRRLTVVQRTMEVVITTVATRRMVRSALAMTDSAFWPTRSLVKVGLYHQLSLSQMYQASWLLIQVAVIWQRDRASHAPVRRF